MSDKDINMKSSEKMLTMEEINNGLIAHKVYMSPEILANIIHASRKGTIPADEAIQLHWPDQAVSARVTYSSKVAMIDCYSPIVYRPTPAWQPKEGEAVFALNQANTMLIGRIVEVKNLSALVMFQDGTTLYVSLSRIKPFDLAKIGLPWSKI